MRPPAILRGCFLPFLPLLAMISMPLWGMLAIEQRLPSGGTDSGSVNSTIQYYVTEQDTLDVRTASGTTILSLEGGSSSPAVALSNDGTLLAVSYYPSPEQPSHIKIYELPSGKLFSRIQYANRYSSDSSIDQISFHPNRTMLSTVTSAAIRTYRVHDGALLHEFFSSSGEAYSVAFSPDGRTLAGGVSFYGEDQVRLWDVATGQLLRILPTPASGKPTALSLSADGTRLAASLQISGDGGVAVWDLNNTGTEPLAFNGWTDSLYAVALSPDGRLVAAGASLETTVFFPSWAQFPKPLQIWRVDDGSYTWPVQSAITPIASIDGIAFTPDGQHLLVNGEKAFVMLRVLPLPFPGWWLAGATGLLIVRGIWLLFRRKPAAQPKQTEAP